MYVACVPCFTAGLALRRINSEDEIRRYLFGSEQPEFSAVHGVFAYTKDAALDTVMECFAVTMIAFFLGGTTMSVVLYRRITS